MLGWLLSVENAIESILGTFIVKGVLLLASFILSYSIGKGVASASDSHSWYILVFLLLCSRGPALIAEDCQGWNSGSKSTVK